MQNAGFKVPKSLRTAVLKDAWGLPVKTLFAQQWIDDWINLDSLVKQKHKTNTMTKAWLEKVASSSACFIACLHNENFFPRDANPGNIMLKEIAPLEFDFLIIDYESIRKNRLLKKPFIYNNLSHLCACLLVFLPEAHQIVAEAYRQESIQTPPENLAEGVLWESYATQRLHAKKIDNAFKRIGRELNKTGGKWNAVS